MLLKAAERSIRAKMNVLPPVSQYLNYCHKEENVDAFFLAPESKTRTNGGKLCRERERELNSDQAGIS